LPRLHLYLYDFFTNCLPPFYGPPCLINNVRKTYLNCCEDLSCEQGFGPQGMRSNCDWMERHGLKPRLPKVIYETRSSFPVCTISAHLGGGCVQDLIFVVVTIAFFVLSLGYVEFCDRIR
jgi:hypothetical protein